MSRTLRPDSLANRRIDALNRHEAHLAAAIGRVTSLERQLAGKCEFREQREKDLVAEKKCVQRIQLTVDRTTANLAANAPHVKPRTQ